MPVRTSLMLALLAMPSAAIGGQYIAGNHLQAYYSDAGTWNSSTYGKGLQVRHASSGTWVDVTYPGSPWAYVVLDYTSGSTTSTYYGNYSTSTYTVDKESDLSSGTTNESYYKYSAGDLTLEKWETWEDTERVMRIFFSVTNNGSSAVSNVDVMHAIDPDQDSWLYGTAATYNDTEDTDGDGTKDWVESAGPTSGWTVGYGLCDTSDSIGHTNWSTTADGSGFSDYAGASADYTMHWLHRISSLAAGETQGFGVLFVFDTSASRAATQYTDAVAADYCNFCDQDSDGYEREECGGEDCDDTDASNYPGSTEYCDGVDNDCDGTVDEDDAVDVTTWYLDADGDNYGGTSTTEIDCDRPTGYVSNAADCDDTDATVNPVAKEVCDGVDNNCDGSIDPDSATDVATWYADDDGDGFGDASSTDSACDQPSGYVADDTDCDDAEASTYPGADEYCDGADDDCDGTVDEDSAVDASTWYRDADGDGYGNSARTDVACHQPSGYVADATDCDDTDSAVSPGSDESCNGVDDDCDGSIDESGAVDASTWYADADGDGYGDAGTSADECDAPTGYVGDATDCDDGDATIYPGATETAYDGIDQDCNGSDLCDSDRDGYDAVECGGEDCDDTTRWISPDAPETWYDGVDQDCDEWSDYDQDFDGHDSDAHGGDDCDDEDDTVYPGAPEIPDGIDNDCNGHAEDDDSDGDGITDEDELDLGLDPDDPDSDGDGILDGDELGDVDDPTDSDGDGLIDALDDDDDDDGIPTADEIGDYQLGDPTDELPDTDGDGLPDHLDEDSDADGFPDEVEGTVDSDGDGVPDYLDDDSDDDGIPDVEELDADTDGDGVEDRLDDDDDGDGISTADELEWAVVDVDGDGTPNWLDEDSDGDGVTDAEEGTGDVDCDDHPNWVDADDLDGPCMEGTQVYMGGCGGCATGLAPGGAAGLLLGLLGLLGVRRRR